MPQIDANFLGGRDEFGTDISSADGTASSFTAQGAVAQRSRRCRGVGFALGGLLSICCFAAVTLLLVLTSNVREDATKARADLAALQGDARRTSAAVQSLQTNATHARADLSKAQADLAKVQTDLAAAQTSLVSAESNINTINQSLATALATVEVVAAHDCLDSEGASICAPNGYCLPPDQNRSRSSCRCTGGWAGEQCEKDPCLKVLEKLCGDKRKSFFECTRCLGQKKEPLEQAGCTDAREQEFCPPPPPLPA
jgi:hypothetical protein